MSPLDVAVIVTALNVLLGLLFLRRRSRERTMRRIAQLEQAAALLRQHGVALEVFLSDPAAPADLRAVLIGFSDAMTDMAVIAQLAERIEDGKWLKEPPSREADALSTALANLRHTNPQLTATFMSAVGSGMAAGLLRSPTAVRSLEHVAAKLVADPERDVPVAAAEGARIKTGFRFGLTTVAPVPA